MTNKERIELIKKTEYTGAFYDLDEDDFNWIISQLEKLGEIEKYCNHKNACAKELESVTGEVLSIIQYNEGSHLP